jgi:hypothetical protein
MGLNMGRQIADPGFVQAPPVRPEPAPPEPTPAEVTAAALLRIERLLVRLVGMAERQSLRAAPPNAQDAARLRPLLVLVGAGPNGRLFTAAELLTYCGRDAPEAVASLGTKALGKLLARCADRPIDGFVVRAEGHRDGVRVWRVQRV